MILPIAQLRKLLEKAIAKAYPDVTELEIPIDRPHAAGHGDYASSVAMKLATQVGQPPREVAQHLVAQIGRSPMLTKAEVAGAGFINFFVAEKWLLGYLAKILADKNFGANASGQAKRMVVEFISANPTGPMTLGNGRGAFAGDTMANVLALAGWRVTREYYLNDVGNQVNILAESVIRRYFQLQGIPTDYPEHLYQGEYITDLAKTLKLDKMKLQDMQTLQARIKVRLLNLMIRDIQRVVEKKLKVKFNTWVRESGLYDRNLDQKVLEHLRRHGLLSEKDGATWFRTSAFGDDKDRVLIKRDGEKTYLLSDVALRFNRFAQRGLDRELIFLGADHHGYVKRLEAIMAALGYAGQIDVQLVQLVRLLRDGKEVKMSKRAGTYVTLEEVVDEVGLDAARFFFLMHAPNTHMDFDITLAKEQSDKNPVYYVQYASARMFSILAKTKKLPIRRLREPAHEAELALIKRFLQLPELVTELAASREVQQLAFYAQDLARDFHDFYTQCRVIEDNHVWDRRLQLVQAARLVLGKTLGLMGITAPERM